MEEIGILTSKLQRLPILDNFLRVIYVNVNLFVLCFHQRENQRLYNCLGRVLKFYTKQVRTARCSEPKELKNINCIHELLNKLLF